MATLTYLLALTAVLTGRLKGDDCNTDLRVLSIVIHHGERAVQHYMSNDENNDKWTVGIGQLTPQGMKQMYKCGQLVRDKYAPLFDHYDSDKLLARSSFVNRAMLSASTFMAALVQPKGNQIFLEGLNWQPVVIYTDTNLHLHVKPEVILEAERRGSHSIINVDLETIKVLEKATGIDLRNDPPNMLNILDNTMTEVEAGFDLPFGLNHNDLESKIRVLANVYFITVANDTTMRCPLGLGLLRDFIDKTEKSLRNESSQYILVSSTHDIHLFAVMSLLTDNNQSEKPPSSAMLIFEVRQFCDCQNYEVKLNYRKDVESDEVQLAIKGCGDPCTFVQLKKIVQNIENDCGHSLS